MNEKRCKHDLPVEQCAICRNGGEGMVKTGTRVIYEAVCRVSWCTKAATVRGICKTHYNRWQMGDPVYVQELGRFAKKGAKKPKPKTKRKPKPKFVEAMRTMAINEVGQPMSVKDDAENTAPEEETPKGSPLIKALDEWDTPLREREDDCGEGIPEMAKSMRAHDRKNLHDFLRHTMLKTQCIIMLLDGQEFCRSAHVQALAQEISESLKAKAEEIA